MDDYNKIPKPFIDIRGDWCAISEWSDNFDYAEFDYADYDEFEFRDNIHSHQRYSREKGWLYALARDRKGNKYIQFLLPNPDGLHCQSIPYRLDWMDAAKFVRTKSVA